jgi:hypothetical protein
MKLKKLILILVMVLYSALFHQRKEWYLRLRSQIKIKLKKLILILVIILFSSVSPTKRVLLSLGTNTDTGNGILFSYVSQTKRVVLSLYIVLRGGMYTQPLTFFVVFPRVHCKLHTTGIVIASL